MSRPIRSILVGVADPDVADAVLRDAQALARRVGAALHVVHAYSPPENAMNLGLAAADVMAGMPPVPVWNIEQARELEDALRARLRAQLPPEGEGPTVVLHVQPGPASAALARVAEETGAELVVLGAGHRHGLGDALLGSTAERALREISAPALVLRRPLPPEGARVLLTTDLGELSATACAVGLGLARTLLAGERFAARCLYVAPAIIGDVPLVEDEAIIDSAGEELDRFLAAIPLEGGRVEPVVRVGTPADEIVAEVEAWPADLVVLGTHGRKGFSRLLLGSVAETIVREVPCGALVIHAAVIHPD